MSYVDIVFSLKQNLVRINLALKHPNASEPHHAGTNVTPLMDNSRVPEKKSFCLHYTTNNTVV